MKITFLGHAGFRIEGSKTFLIDPWLGDNPAASCAVEDVGDADYIIATHDHFDHFADIPAISKQTGAPVVGVFETAGKAGEESGVEAVGCNLGGTVKLDGCEVLFTPAFHSMSSNPSGVILWLDGKVIYHAGDTALFTDMKLLGELYPMDLAILPIGGHFTMGVREAVKAVEFLAPKQVVPCHFNTFDLINADTGAFSSQSSAPVTVLEPGASLEL
jgi:L-ascorbate metabolism protein UlaG (beta-lactamase superfamily)